MAAEGLAVKTIKELFRLRLELKLNQRQVAKAIGCGRTTIQRYERKARKEGLNDFNLINNLSSEELLRRFGLNQEDILLTRPLRKKDCTPDWQKIHEQLIKYKHTTLALLWEEYREEYPEGFSYSQFCEHFRRWKKALSVVMRQEHKAGEKAFVDYAGSTIDIIDSCTGEVREAQVFVGVLGASSLTYAEATLTQALPDWLMSHRRMLQYFGGVPQIIVSDNLRSGVSRADRYEAGINPSYQELAEHYGFCVIPTRVRKPQDKSKVEVGVLLASRWIIAALRHKTFFSIEELNKEIEFLLEKINHKKMRYYKKSRRELFEEIDKSALGVLRQTPYEYAEWKDATINIDHHIVYDDHFYSAPYKLISKKIQVRATSTIVELYFKNERIASHLRSYKKGKFTTNPTHRPPSHQEHLKWTPERIISWARTKGENIALFVGSLIDRQAHPEQGYRSSLGVIRLTDKYGVARVNQACGNALAIDAIKYQTVKNMLKNGMDHVVSANNKNQKQKDFFTLNENVRGKEYYH
jgi:transposase